MDDHEETTRTALKIVLMLSIILVFMDIMEVYFSYQNLDKAMKVLEFALFEECYKYHILSQMIFTVFATFSGLSAFLMSFGLLINYDLFISKFLDTFMYLNYMIFGPFLFGASMLGCMYFSEVVYNCERGNVGDKYMNMSTLFSLLICAVISIIITFGFAILFSFNYMIKSITGRGNKLLKKLFWTTALRRRNEELLQREGDVAIN
jgi:hypothetical protein